MNPWDLSASDLLVWGIVLHLIADWPLQNDWMANNKQRLGGAASCVHAGIHTLLLAFVFGWVALPLGIVHALIDTRRPVVWWSRKIRQTQPGSMVWFTGSTASGYASSTSAPPYDVGTEVRFWTDQVFHIATIALAALLVV